MCGLNGPVWNRSRVVTAAVGALVIALAAYGVVGGVNAGPATPAETSSAASTDIEPGSELEFGPCDPDSSLPGSVCQSRALLDVSFRYWRLNGPGKKNDPGARTPIAPRCCAGMT